jgi:MFS family permease
VPEIIATFSPEESSSTPSSPSEQTQTLGSFIVTAYILGLGFAPILIGPLSDLFGRALVMRIAMVCFTGATAACGAAPSMGALAGLRFLAGCFGGTPMVIGGAVVADLYPEGKRRGPLIAWNAGQILAPMGGPVIGGAITHAIGWRWALWISAIAVSVLGGCLKWWLYEMVAF